MPFEHPWVPREWTRWYVIGMASGYSAKAHISRNLDPNRKRRSSHYQRWSYHPQAHGRSAPRSTNGRSNHTDLLQSVADGFAIVFSSWSSCLPHRISKQEMEQHQWLSLQGVFWLQRKRFCRSVRSLPPLVSCRTDASDALFQASTQQLSPSPSKRLQQRPLNT